MAVPLKQKTLPTTVEQFDVWVHLPENAGRDYEFIGGRVVEKVVSNNESSRIAGIIFGELYAFIKGKELGSLTPLDGGYKVDGERYIPDVAFISYTKLPKPTREAYVSSAPDLTVEVLSPSNTVDEVNTKLHHYLNAGVTVWMVNPDKRTVEVHAQGQDTVTLTDAETLDGGTVLPGFSLPVKDIFPK